MRNTRRLTTFNRQVAKQKPACPAPKLLVCCACTRTRDGTVGRGRDRERERSSELLPPPTTCHVCTCRHRRALRKSPVPRRARVAYESKPLLASRG